MHDKIGSAWYVAPEVLAKKYDKRCDLWSVGVVTFVLLSGNLPFCGNSRTTLNERIRSADYAFNGPNWQNSISHNAKDFIRKLLVLNANERMSLEEAINHPWICNKIKADEAENLHTLVLPIFEKLL